MKVIGKHDIANGLVYELFDIISLSQNSNVQCLMEFMNIPNPSGKSGEAFTSVEQRDCVIDINEVFEKNIKNNNKKHRKQ